MKKILIIIILFLIFIGSAFVLGLNWTKITAKPTPKSYSYSFTPSPTPDKKLACFGHSANGEIYLVNCYSPLSKAQKNFTFKDKIKCNILTNHQLSNSNETKVYESPPVYDHVSLQKADYKNFTLNIDYKNNEVIQSRWGGEPKKDPYVIIQNDDRVLNAIRKNLFDKTFGYTYEYITISKKTGKGTSVWTNTDDYDSEIDSFAVEFFQCE